MNDIDNVLNEFACAGHCHKETPKERVMAEEIVKLRKQLNTPEVLDFAKAVQLEAAHQRQRWGSAHDGGKTDADWFWLIGYLAGKALHNPYRHTTGDEIVIAPPEYRDVMWKKQLHRIVTVAAAAANWHMAVLGKTDMRPGIEEPL